MEDRFNCPHTRCVEVDAMGTRIRVVQDPNSKHVGTTVWDSSIVVLKYMERQSRSGSGSSKGARVAFARERLRGKRAIELGAGCGLAGIGLALLGCDVTLTDQVEVLPLLFRNVERNCSQAKMEAAADSDAGKVVGSADVAELDWGNADHIAAASPPFDYILGTDVVYSEGAVEALVKTLIQLSHRRTIILLGYEFRSPSVHSKLHAALASHFTTKKIPPAKLDPVYQHPAIDVYLLKPRPHLFPPPTLPPSPGQEEEESDLCSCGETTRSCTCTPEAARVAAGKGSGGDILSPAQQEEGEGAAEDSAVPGFLLNPRGRDDQLFALGTPAVVRSTSGGHEDHGRCSSEARDGVPQSNQGGIVRAGGHPAKDKRLGEGCPLLNQSEQTRASVDGDDARAGVEGHGARTGVGGEGARTSVEGDDARASERSREVVDGVSLSEQAGGGDARGMVTPDSHQVKAHSFSTQLQGLKCEQGVEGPGSCALSGRNQNEWEVRRLGAMASRLLAGVEAPVTSNGK